MGVKVCREGEILSYSVNAEVNESKGVGPIFSAYKKLDWEICLGCCFTPLSIPLITGDDDMSNISDLSIKTINTLERFLNYNNRKKDCRPLDRLIFIVKSHTSSYVSF